MNENLVERFGRSRRGDKAGTTGVHVWVQPQRLNLKVRQYFEDAKKGADGGHWLQRPEIPTSEEIMDTDTGSSSSSDIVEIVPNRPKGAWASKEEYLSAQYELLREDAVRPLREAVSQLRVTPTAVEDALSGTIGIYDKVHICAITPSTRGIALRVTFSLQRAGKKILWDQSKRLISGSLVALTPVSDMFKTKAVVGTVAARPLTGLQQNPPEIDLFIARAGEIEIDPAVEWVIVEARAGFYEAVRHTLLALQKMMREPVPMAEHLVEASASISAPRYVQDSPKHDLTSVLRDNKHETYEGVDILKRWPAQPSSDLDASQLAALRRILTKSLAIVQGPPGTGKTHVSVQAIKIMLANRKADDAPVIVACQTNHAVDQILHHIAPFESEFVRLGGRSKDREIIKARTLYEVRNMTSESPLPGCLVSNAKRKMKLLEREITALLLPLKPEKTPMNPTLLCKLGLLTEAQAQSLETGASQWVQDKMSNPNQARNPFNVWMGSTLITVPPKQLPEELGFDYEEADLEFEQLKELEAENVAKDDEDFESLSGLPYTIADNYTCRAVPGMTEAKVKDALKERDMWKIPEAVRGAIYRHLQNEMKQRILIGFREKAKEYNELAMQRRIGFWEQDECVLKRQKIIGMTTTGFSKYRGLLAALEPKTVLIEEAAEILEAPVIVTCLPSLQHLILVGDHQQLRPHCQVKAHEDKPYYLNVSLFERLVNNAVEYSTLSKQRRMIPEIRRLLLPIYGDLIKDHASVLDPEKRPPVPGMGGVNSFFFTHQWPEQRDDRMSAFNPDEADMIVGFVEYLVYNGMDTKDITVLTFYNGQRKKLLSTLRQNVSLLGHHFNVVTVDSYQGEENKVIILSLVRSNDKGQIGFLSIDNRVCVALSRAQCGFFIFGNGMLLYKHKIWQKIIVILAGKKNEKERPKIEPVSRLDQYLPVRCRTHNNQIKIKEPGDWEKINGGCQLKCDGKLPCGHDCGLMCHPFSHDLINCRQHCGKALACGHGRCEAKCGEVCSCKLCSKGRMLAQIADIPAEPYDGKEQLSHKSTSSTESWKSYAVEEPGRYAKLAASAELLRLSTDAETDTETKLLLDLTPTDAKKALSLGYDGTRSDKTASLPVPVVEEKLLGDGSRKKWTEKVHPTVTVAEVQHVKDWSKEESLLD